MTVQKLAVLGSPVSHSLSPKIHNAIYRRLGLDWQYGAFDIKEAEFDDFIISHASYLGFSVTMPLKYKAYNIAQNKSENAKISKLANTLRLKIGGENNINSGRNMRISCENTDIYGIIKSIEKYVLSGDFNGKISILGAGATALSAYLALLHFGVKNIEIYARNPKKFLLNSYFNTKTVEIEEIFDKKSQNSDSRNYILAQKQGERTAKKAGHKVRVGPAESFILKTFENGISFGNIISTFPGGVLTGGDFKIDKDAFLLDVAYSPWPSYLASIWPNNKVIKGTDMLIYQGLAQIRYFLHGNSFKKLENEEELFNICKKEIE